MPPVTVSRTDACFVPDPRRVVARRFVPGENLLSAVLAENFAAVAHLPLIPHNASFETIFCRRG
jgi:hypothetical protein